MRRFQFSQILSAFTAALFACSDPNSDATSPENTASFCNDSEDNDGDGNIDCDDPECLVFEHCISPSDTEAADVSGMPIPPIDEVPVPSGAPSNLKILDWAGFKAAVSYSFDDTHPSQLEHYAALKDFGVRMTFFAVNTTAKTDVEGWRRVVSDGHELGNHTAHHCHGGLQGECAFGEAFETATEELESCSAFITNELGQESVWTLASPYGERWWGMQAEAFVFLNRNVNDGTIAPNDETDPLGLPSVMLSGTAIAEELIGDIDAVHETGEWLIFCIHALLPTAFEASWGIPIDVITESMAHGVALDDLWIDSMVNVGAYWMGQKLLSAAESETDGDETVLRWTLPPLFPPGKYLRGTVEGGTLSQNGRKIPWSTHGYYEISLDEGELTFSP